MWKKQWSKFQFYWIETEKKQRDFGRDHDPVIRLIRDRYNRSAAKKQVLNKTTYFSILYLFIELDTQIHISTSTCIRCIFEWWMERRNCIPYIFVFRKKNFEMFSVKKKWGILHRMIIRWYYTIPIYLVVRFKDISRNEEGINWKVIGYPMKM